MRKFSTVELLRDLKTVTHAAARAPVAITQHRKPRFVLMALEDFDRLQAKKHFHRVAGDGRRTGRRPEGQIGRRPIAERGSDFRRILAQRAVGESHEPM